MRRLLGRLLVLIVGIVFVDRLRRRPHGSRRSRRTKLIVGLGYIPSVQFAQFYRAEQQGYYDAAGLDVTFQNGMTRT